MARKVRRIWLAGLLSLTVLIIGQTPNLATAKERFVFSTNSSAAKKAFSKILTNPKTISNWWGDSRDYTPKLSDISFVCFDIGKAKVPIMCMKNSKYAEGLCNVHQFVNGKSKFLCGDDKIEYVYPDKGIIVTSYMGGVGPNGYTDTSFSCVKNKTSLGKKIAYTRIWRFRASGSHLKNQYKINNKTVTKKKFDEWKKKILSGAKRVRISSKHFRKNAVTERNKYFGSFASSSKSKTDKAVGKQPFWGIWCDAYKTKASANKAVSKLIKKGFSAKAVITTDWNNLNKDKWYVVTAGVYSSEKKAKAALPGVRSVYESAYVKYSGSYRG